MKQYKRHRTSAEVLTACVAAGIPVDRERFDRGWDHLMVYLQGPTDICCPVLYNVTNGRFFCAAEGFPYFTSDDAGLDGQPWFDAMLDFFYTDEEAPQ